MVGFGKEPSFRGASRNVRMRIANQSLGQQASYFRS
jgi:hypothetical protein